MTHISIPWVSMLPSIHKSWEMRCISQVISNYVNEGNKWWLFFIVLLPHLYTCIVILTWCYVCPSMYSIISRHHWMWCHLMYFTAILNTIPFKAVYHKVGQSIVNKWVARWYNLWCSSEQKMHAFQVFGRCMRFMCLEHIIII